MSYRLNIYVYQQLSEDFNCLIDFKFALKIIKFDFKWNKEKKEFDFLTI